MFSGKNKEEKPKETRYVEKSEGSFGKIMGGLAKVVPVIVVAFILISLRTGTMDKEQITVKSYNYNDKLLSGKIFYEDEKPSGIRGLFNKKEVRAINKDDKFIALLDFNSRNATGEFDRFSSKVDHIVANKKLFSEVIVKIYSTGGSVIDYGSAMSQIKRLKNAGIKVTSTVDEVAASGGYLMAVVSDKIYANEFAFVGSIGVVASVPNVKKLLDKYGVSFDEYTAGESKRTITPFKDPTADDIDKMNESLLKVHNQFKKVVSDNRVVDASKVFNGDIFYGDEAIELGLIDEFKSTGDLIFDRINSGYEVYHIIANGNKKTEDNVMKVGFVDSTINTIMDRIMLETNKGFFF